MTYRISNVRMWSSCKRIYTWVTRFIVSSKGLPRVCGQNPPMLKLGRDWSLSGIVWQAIVNLILFNWPVRSKAGSCQSFSIGNRELLGPFGKPLELTDPLSCRSDFLNGILRALIQQELPNGGAQTFFVFLFFVCLSFFFFFFWSFLFRQSPGSPKSEKGRGTRRVVIVCSYKVRASKPCGDLSCGGRRLFPHDLGSLTAQSA